MRFKLEAYKTEFPFLAEIIGEGGEPDKVRVARADENLLARTPRHYYRGGSCGETEAMDEVAFVLEDGKIIKNAVSQQEDGERFDIDRPRWSSEGESVLEGIARHGVAESLKYIVWDSRYYDGWAGRGQTEEWEVIVYKPPKNTSFKEAVEKAMARTLGPRQK